MSAGFLRNGTKTYHSIHKILQKQPATDSIGAAIIRSQPHHRQQQSRVYARFSQSVYRRTREFQLSPPSVLSSSFSSSTTVSSSRNGLVGWYLETVKARPILTKSITGALIYTAADLSSQTIVLSSSESYDFSSDFTHGWIWNANFGTILAFLVQLRGKSPSKA